MLLTGAAFGVRCAKMLEKGRREEVKTTLKQKLIRPFSTSGSMVFFWCVPVVLFETVALVHTSYNALLLIQYGGR